MTHQMPRFLQSTLLALLATCILATAETAEWMSDFKAASAKAAKEKKLMLLDFTGSDWCGWCIRLKKEVFDQAQFKAYAAKHLVLVELDFPRRKSISAATRRQNEALGEKYQVRGYPTLVFLDPQGKEVGRGGYEAGGPSVLIKQLEGIRRQNPGTVSLEEESPAGAVEPLWAASVKQAPARDYSGLKLKGISGGASRRIALINGASLSTGEDARVTLQGKSVRIHCLAITASSATVQLDGEPTSRELTLD